MNYAPIALFTYNRADHTKQAVESLLKNAEAKYSDLFIFSDGPKNDKAVEGVKANRTYIRSLKEWNDIEISQSRDTENAHSSVSLVNYHKENKFSQDNSSIPSDDSQSASLRKEPSASDDATQSNTPSLNREGRGESFKSVTIIEREKNWGLANSLIAGITEIVNKYGRVIVVEDDLILSPYFLRFMNEALEKYKDDDRVGAISAYMPVINEVIPNAFFLHYFHCWGWATWKCSWDMLNTDVNDLLKKIRWKTKKFNMDGAMENYGMLYCQKKGIVDSWYIQFYASLFLKDKLVLFPKHSLVRNIGLDRSGVHSSHSEETVQQEHINVYPSTEPINLVEIPIKEDEKAYKAYRNVYKKNNSLAQSIMLYIRRIKSFVRRVLGIDLL